MEELKDLGLSGYEANAYLILLKLGSVTAFTLSKWSGVPFGRIYDVLESLIIKGLVVLESQKPKRFRALSPKIGLYALLKKKENEWNMKRTKLDDLIKTLEIKKSIEEPVSFFKTKESYYEGLSEYLRTAKKEVLHIAGHLMIDEKRFGYIARDKKIAGVIQKVIVPVTKENLRIARRLSKFLEIRNYSSKISGLRLTIVDGKSCIISIRDPILPYKHITIDIKSKSFAQSLRELYKALWKQAKPLNKLK